MNTNLKTTKEVMELLDCKKATFFAHQAKLGIHPHKKGNKNYYDQEQVKTFQESLDGVPISSKHNPDTNNQSPDSNQTEPDRTETITTDPDELKTHLKQEIKRLQGELKEAQKEAQEKIQTLSGQVGHWQGRAQAYQEQNQKLLEQVKTSEPEKETIIISPAPEKEVEEAEIIDADTIKEEKIPGKNPEKKGWWRSFWEG